MSASAQVVAPRSADEPIRLELRGDVCLAAFAPRRGQGAATLLKASDVGAAAVDAALSGLVARLGDEPALLELKLVGPSAALRLVVARLTARGLAPKGQASREASRCVCFYYPSSGRLRVENEGTGAGGAAIETRLAPGPRAEMRRTRVLIVDDSKTIRTLLTGILAQDGEIEVVAAAAHPSEVFALIDQHRPDVLTLDIHMPDMDGVTLLKLQMAKYRLPTVMITSVAREDGPLVLQALEAGAVDYIQKPTAASLAALTPLIVERVKMAAKARLRPAHGPATIQKALRLGVDEGRVVAIGASTGGTEALRVLLTSLGEQIPPILIVQHIPAGFSRTFAERINSLCPFEVKEAEVGDLVAPNRVLIAPGGFHMRLATSPSGFMVTLDESEPRARHRPSVDVLFESVAQHLGARAVGVILTGMGADGAEGLKKMRESGARTLGQSEGTCVVYGMPRRAFEIGAVESVLDLGEMPAVLSRLYAPGARRG